MTKTVVLIAVAIAAAVVAVVFWLRPPPEGPLVVSGFVEADQIRVGSRVGGRVRLVHVEEGDRVEKGAALVEFEPFDLAELRAATAAVLKQAEATLAALVAGARKEEIAAARARKDALAAVLEQLVNGPRAQEISTAEARLASVNADRELAKIEFDRVASLVKKGVNSSDDLDRAQARLSSAIAAVDARSAELSLLREGTRPEQISEARALVEEATQRLAQLENGSRSEDIDRAAAEVAAARARLAVVERQLEELIITAPGVAEVEAIELDPGDLAAPNAPVVELIDPKTLWVRSFVPESRLDIPIGRIVAVSVDAFPGRSFRGRVTFVSRQAEFLPSNVQTPEERSKQVFRIKVALEEGLDELRAGMAADVTFIEEKSKR